MFGGEIPQAAPQTLPIFQVGYGDLYPESAMGRIVASITAFLGALMDGGYIYI